MKRSIRLRGMNGAFKGRMWESSDQLRTLNDIQKYLTDQMYRVYGVSVHRYWARSKDVRNYRATSWFPYSEFETTWFAK